MGVELTVLVQRSRRSFYITFLALGARGDSRSKKKRKKEEEMQ